ncbi:hypothetical protein [Nesterenkonia sphaerica]|uniref:EcsC family protein n=1 Tax=Nesterenkonia sphaerica TaxID=1804988 RepID=A0A5R9A2F3_9MICC|nr:hypothetical protein [Nesterenkonia sphaerica]TLP72891.1 hypothetical protein FEF27_11265 [Nesterenkonia sphaerica]
MKYPMTTGDKSEESCQDAAAEEVIGLRDPALPAEQHDSISGAVEQQDSEAEEFAVEFLNKVLRLRGVRIDREHFLKTELHKRGFPAEVIDEALRSNPAAAGLTPVMLDSVAQASIEFETRKSTGLSFAAGLPGGFGLIGTVPADITQYYVHAFRVMQKVAYVYGWQSFLQDTEDIDDETLGKLAAFLGVMLGVGGASASLKSFAVQVARPAIQKKIATTALTKTTWYVPMKQTLRVIGVHVTKQSFAKSVTKIVPVVGGVLSGGLTFMSLKIQSKRLKEHLRELPPPNVDAAEYLKALKRADEADTDQNERSNPVRMAAKKSRSLVSGQNATTKVRRAAAGTKGALGSVLHRKSRESPETVPDSPEAAETSENSADLRGAATDE